MKYAIFDIDHTISDAYWRDHMIGGEGGWDAYHQACEQDEPIEPMIELVNIINIINHDHLHYNEIGLETIALTARPEKWRALTCSQLLKFNCQFDHLLMRPNDDFNAAADSKLILIKDFLGKGFPSSVSFIIDDNEKVIEKFAAAGVTTLHINASRRQMK